MDNSTRAVLQAAYELQVEGRTPVNSKTLADAGYRHRFDPIPRMLLWAEFQDTTIDVERELALLSTLGATSPSMCRRVQAATYARPDGRAVRLSIEPMNRPPEVYLDSVCVGFETGGQIQAIRVMPRGIELLHGSGDAGRQEPEKGSFDLGDCRSFAWNGANYSFTAMQAAAVKCLWQAFEAGKPDISDATLIEHIDSDAKRLRDLFRKHPAWGTAIVTGETKGTHRLAPTKTPT